MSYFPLRFSSTLGDDPKTPPEQSSEPDEAADDASSNDSSEAIPVPRLLHRFRHDKSILCLVADEEHIYAGTQGGDILVFTLKTWERLHAFKAHKGSVLGLCLVNDRKWLISSAGDRLVNVWTSTGLQHVATVYSTLDVGDIFCVAYSTKFQQIYLGCQNTSIQWRALKDDDLRPVPASASVLSPRCDKFFDSVSHGARKITTRFEKEAKARSLDCHTGRLLEIDRMYLRQFAHFGYVFCMSIINGASINVPADEVLVSGGGDGAIRLWKLDDHVGGRLTPLFSLEDQREESESVLALTIDGSFLYSGHIGGEVHTWNLESKQLLRVIYSSDEDILSVAFGSGNLFSADENGEIRTYDQRLELTRYWRAHNSRVLASCTANRHDRQILVTGAADDTIAVWDMSDVESSEINLEGSSFTYYEDAMVKDLQEMVSYRTVSSDPRYKPDCHKGASYLMSVFKKFGAHTQSFRTNHEMNPLVFARFRGIPKESRECKQLLFYGHYDVVPAENPKKWVDEPFRLFGSNGYLWGRGASDNKGPVMAAIYAVAHLRTNKQLHCDVLFLVEGEEENGSLGFEATVKSSKSIIGDVDWILLANSYWLNDETPCITYGLRGVIHATVEIKSMRPDLHSGVDGSRLLDEPLKDLVMLIGKLTGPRGAVQIPDFYTSVPPITPSEIQHYNDISRVLLAHKPYLGTPETLAQSLMHRWRDPSLTIHGFKPLGSEHSTIIPRRASVDFSLRIVPNQDVNNIADSLRNFLVREFATFGSRNYLTIKINNTAEPWLGNTTNELFQTLESAVSESWSCKPLYIREGGSIPAVRFLEKEFNAPAAHLPCGQAGDSAHLDNERIRVVNLYKAREVLQRVFSMLGDLE